MRRVLATGAAGFIGGGPMNELLERDYQVVGVDNLSKYDDVEPRDLLRLDAATAIDQLDEVVTWVTKSFPEGRL